MTTTDKRIRPVPKDVQDRRLHTLPIWARERIKNVESKHLMLYQGLHDLITAYRGARKGSPYVEDAATKAAIAILERTRI